MVSAYIYIYIYIYAYIYRVLPSKKIDVSKGPSRQFLRGLFTLRRAYAIHIPKSGKNIYGNSFSLLK